MITIYLEDASEKRIISQRVEEDKAHPVFSCFYQALKRYPLPGANEHILHVVLEDTQGIRMKYFTNKAYISWKNALENLFPEVEDANFNGTDIYVFLKKDSNLEKLKSESSLEMMRQTCYSEIVKCAGSKRGLPYDAFHIKADNSGIYQERGSRYYWDCIADIPVTAV